MLVATAGAVRTCRPYLTANALFTAFGTGHIAEAVALCDATDDAAAVVVFCEVGGMRKPYFNKIA